MKITIFTPTYNRGYILPRTYKSLLKQNNMDFEWVIIDDGSEDNTKELVQSWIQDESICIKYLYQENQGRYCAFNNGKHLFDGELVVFLDSDDYLLDDAISKIIDVMSLQEFQNCSGILGYLEGSDGNIIGTEFPETIDKERLFVLYDKYRMTGDKFISLKNNLIQKYSYPYFDGEKFTGDSIVFNRINDEFPMFLMREKLEHREYINDGLTNNRINHHINSPNGMAEHYLDALIHEKYNKFNMMKHSIGYIAFSKLSNRSNQKILKAISGKAITILLYPVGVIYYFWLKRK
jgi:glycosyltransferase involved in cell wall biosynthesis